MHDESFIKTLLESFVVVCLLSAARKINRNFSLLGGSNSQIFKGTSRRRMCVLERYK